MFLPEEIFFVVKFREMAKKLSLQHQWRQNPAITTDDASVGVDCAGDSDMLRSVRLCCDSYFGHGKNASPRARGPARMLPNKSESAYSRQAWPHTGV